MNRRALFRPIDRCGRAVLIGNIAWFKGIADRVFESHRRRLLARESVSSSYRRMRPATLPLRRICPHRRSHRVSGANPHRALRTYERKPCAPSILDLETRNDTDVITHGRGHRGQVKPKDSFIPPVFGISRSDTDRVGGDLQSHRSPIPSPQSATHGSEPDATRSPRHRRTDGDLGLRVLAARSRCIADDASVM
jgi:hypothetical protein